MSRVISSTGTHSGWLRFEDLRHRNETHPLRDVEVPTEHSVSLLLPTRRWETPGFACFASPALREPSKPLEVDPPDRWWVLDARNGSLVVYARVQAVAFAEGAHWGPVTVQAMGSTLAEVKERLATIGQLLDELAPAFFSGEAGDPARRRQLAELLRAHLSTSLLPRYRALVPDFFGWLES